MGFFDKYKKRHTVSASPVWHSKIDDVEYWETVAYGWICDADGEEARDRAWARFVEAYPEHAAEIAGDFWHRIRRTEWHHRHGHEHHHRHREYC